jgi:hypothetical protein
MSANTPVKRNDGEGPARGYSWESFKPGNRAAAKSAFYVSALAASEREEVQTIADAIRALSPLDGEAQEPLVQLVAAQIWRQRVAVAYIDEAGIEMVARSSSLLRDLGDARARPARGPEGAGADAASRCRPRPDLGSRVGARRA